MSSASSSKIEFYGSNCFVFIPIIIFLAITVYLFIFAKAFDMNALAMGGFLGLVVGAFFSKNWVNYWNGAISGIATELTGVLVCILVLAGVFSDMMKAGGIASGFVWLGLETGITGAHFCAFTFIASAVIATSTGTSIGTIFTCVPVFFAAGVQLGADPAMLAGAILSGAIFGDNLAPVSDVTVISASTQTYKASGATAEVGGVVLSRLPYALIAAAITLPIYFIFGGGGAVNLSSITDASPSGLVMILPVIFLVIIAIMSRNIFLALILGILSGVIIGFISGRFDLSQLFFVQDGHVSGFLYAGVSNMAGTIMLCLSLFAVIGIFDKSGTLDLITQKLSNTSDKKMSPRKAEIILAIGAIICSTVLAGVTSASTIMFGPIANKIGRLANIHPFRRSHIISSMANSLPVILPFSAFVFIVMIAVQSQYMGDAITPFTLLYSGVYPWALLIVFSVSMLTGWGRRFEGKGRQLLKQVDLNEK